MEEDTTTEHRRVVSGELVSSVVAQATSMRLEMLRRRSGGRISWSFCQPQLALFWFRQGVGRVQLKIDGSSVNARLSTDSSLGLFPANVGITGEFETDQYCEYAVVFLDQSFVAARNALEIHRPLVAFNHDPLKHGLTGLCREAIAPDKLFDLFAEGWALQAIAHLSRINQAAIPGQAEGHGGLPPLSLRRVEDYIRANLPNAITLTELSEIAGLSPRHFLRAFQHSVGATPLGHVRALRIEEAKQRLTDASQSITKVALDCGFSHAQHFTTSFRIATGLTPSAFRRLHLF